MKQIPGYETYFLTEDGAVFSTKSWKWMKLPLVNGYIQVRLRKCGKTITHNLHRILYKTFRPEEYSEDKLVRHLDDNRLNNELSNLKAGSHYDNMQDSIRNGSAKGAYKLTEERVLEIRAMHNNGMRICEIASKLRMADNHISAIVKRRIWRKI